MNQLLEDYLFHFCSYDQDNWDKCLDLAVFSTNNLDSSSLKFNIMTQASGCEDLDEFLVYLQQTQEMQVECLIQARTGQAKHYNAHKRGVSVYKEGNQVLLLRKFIQS